MKKHILTWMLATFCLLSLLTGCASPDKPSSEDPVTLSMWHVYGSQTKSPLVLKSAHNQYVERVDNGEAPDAVLTDLTNTSCEALKKAFYGTEG